MKIATEDEIITTVGKLTEISPEVLLQGQKNASGHTMDVLVICIAILRHELNVEGISVRKMTCYELRDKFHYRNHSSITHAVKTFNNLIETNKYFRCKAGLVCEGITKLLIPQNDENKN